MQKHFVKLRSKVVTSVTPEVGRWHFRLMFTRDWATMTGRQFQFGLFKLLERPPVGEVLQKKHYKGFYFLVTWQPWDGFLWNFNFEFPKAKIRSKSLDELKEMAKNTLDQEMLHQLMSRPEKKSMWKRLWK